MREFRTTIYAFGHEITGKWLAWNLETFDTIAHAMAENECAFTVEFRYIEA